ncbi:hypothetical protein LRP50_06540 [Enterovibrio sp. ZSDZ42]|uniref:Uncharacterized protein n=1 Tax=Enterovibrio gelatinilyticus TaxID=2899819 RepID=A0ABT5QXQ0_9GAMM|nr:hypothetical protein [Enterovibrio sp. ZSDZ42]MDD1792778.1 hypothetical protein [Enterovibrio sp. ZSDZ42]
MSKLHIALFLSLLGLHISGCSEEINDAPKAKFGNSGSLDGPYSIRDVLITDTSGASSNLGYGSVSSYPGASASISGLGIPAHISGYWSKPSDTSPHPVAYYRLDSAIDSKLAKQKVATLKGAYTKLKDKPGTIQVVVNKDQIQVFYTFKCFDVYDDCEKKEGADPNGWIQASPDGNTDVVMLFSGKGETSPTAFPASPYDKRLVRAKSVESTNITELILTSENGKSYTLGDNLDYPTSFSISWAKKTNPEADFSEWQFERYRLSGEFNAPALSEEAIQAYRRATNGYIKTSTFDIFAEDDSLFITYSAACLTDTVGERCEVAKDPENRWRYFDEIGRHALILFHGKGQKVPQ